MLQLPDLDALARPVRPDVRRRIEDAIERLIGLLDEIDGDPDDEPECEDEGADDQDEFLVEIHPLDRPDA